MGESFSNQNYFSLFFSYISKFMNQVKLKQGNKEGGDKMSTPPYPTKGTTGGLGFLYL